MKKTIRKSSLPTKTTVKKKGVLKTTKKKKISLKKFDYENYPKIRLSYAEYVRRHALAGKIMDEIEEEELENIKGVVERVLAERAKDAENGTS
ncbi:hypothetical protein SAMN04488109_5338 [Chryseolinea serpens]|uniref:Uncharacterized protein n=1 Tax=Chryseolinea serpens TaxID=947013 RepID=A0A1M5VSD1_9BACT|nr:hypothetical protein [Chryseolinea serpens]SHH77833.1 hypothetical protein SAMN04488109_5338 [Chryseolinea serpens]